MTNYMEKAYLESLKSNDPNTQVGCVIVKDDVVVSVGHNHLPYALTYDNYPMEVREGSFIETKYAYVLHSEAMAISDAKVPLDNSSMYVTLFPCNECAKLIIHAKIKNVYYLEDKYADTESIIAAKIMFRDANVNFEQINR